MRSMPLACLNLKTARMTGVWLCALLQKVSEKHEVVGDESIRVHTATRNNEEVVEFAVDSMTNYVWSVKCVEHIFSLRLNNVYKKGNVWEEHINLVNDVTPHFLKHFKVSQMLVKKQLESRIINDRLRRLLSVIPT